MNIQNTQKKWANAMAIMSLLGFAMFALPWIAEIDPAEGGGALLLVGLLLGITGIITYFMFRRRAKEMDEILNNRNIIARWKVSSLDWGNFAEKDVAALKSSAWATWLTIAFFFVVFTAFFWFITEDAEEANFFLMLMGAVFGFISIFAWLATVSRSKSRLKQNEGEVIIADNCLTLNNEFHAWKGMGNILESVNYYEADRILEFTYSFVSRYGRQFQEVRVPVPSTEEEKLQKVLMHFGIKPMFLRPESTELEEMPEQDSSFVEKKKDVESEGFEIKF